MMESKKVSQEFASIDENPVACRSIDTNQARINLQRLQDHVNQQFSNVSNHGPCHVGAMNSGRGQEPPTSFLGIDLIQRPPSIKDEDDLFRGESDSNHSTEDRENQLQNFEPTVGDEKKSTEAGDIDRSVSVFENSNHGDTEAGLIPDFDKIGFSFSASRSSGSSDNAEHLTVEFKPEPKADNVMKAVDIGNVSGKITDKDSSSSAGKDPEKFDFKVRYRGKRSQSDVKEKRQRYSQQEDFAIEEEVPVFEGEYPVPVRKSNSLPDLILSLSSSSNSSTRSVSDRKSPDVVFHESNEETDTENQRARKNLKDSFEGKSSFEKSDTSDFDTKKGKPSFRRSVSFNEKTDCRIYETGDPAISPGVFDEKIEYRLQDEKHTSILSVQSSRCSGQYPDQQEEKPPQSPEVPAEGRRQLFSKSSGYQTGSDHSRESHDTQNGSFEKSEFQNDTKNVHMQYLNANDIPDSGNFNSGTSRSSSSNDTILETIIDESNRYMHMNDFQSASAEESKQSDSEKTSVLNCSPELPFLSIMDKSPQSSLTNYKVEKKDIGLAEDTGLKAATASKVEQKTGEQLQGHLLMSALDYRRSQSTLGPSIPGSIGNVPKFGILDDSVILNPSLLAKVDEEDKQQEDKVRRKYMGGSLNMAVDESMTARQSLSSHPVPSLLVQEFEAIIMNNANDPDKISAALHKLMESSSSSPRHSPFEPGEGRHSASSPRNKLFTVEELERASRCSDTKCPERVCVKMQRFSMLLKLDVDMTETNTSLMVVHFLEAIYLHSQKCEDLMCPVLYCQECSKWCPHGWDPTHLLQQIKGHMKNPLSYLEQKSDPRFIKLQDSIGDTVPQQFITYIPLSLLHVSGKMLLVQDLQKQTLCVIKEHPLFEDSHQINVMRSLRNLEHPNIVSQFWMLEFTEEIQVCYQFMQGGSLREYLDLMVDGLGWSQAAKYLKQITDAVCFLHQRGVIYLYWQSSNMVFPDTRREMIKISDFAFSHHVDGQPDIGALKQCLPFNLCPPELLNSNIVCEKSDCWGVACLLAEILTGTPVWYDLRHEDRETAHKKIKNNVPFMEEPLPTDQKIIFENCWKINPDKRCSMRKLNEFLNIVLTKS